MNSRARIRSTHCLSMAVAAACTLAIAACDLFTGPDGGDESPIILSDPAVARSAGSGLDVLPATMEAPNAYVSLAPGTVPSSGTATLTNRMTGEVVRVAVMEGGFDPVPIAASAGDTIEIEVPTGTQSFLLKEEVPDRRPPTIVRTSPPRGKRDVPLNATVVVVFSEPVDPSTVTAGSVRVLRDGAPIAGDLVLSTDGLTVGLVPAATLSPHVTYTLTVATEIRDLQGDALENSYTAEFTTGESVLELLKATDDGATAEVGSTIVVGVKLLADGVPARNIAVFWAVTSGGGSIAPHAERTDTGGYLMAEWTLGAATGIQTAQAAVAGATGSPVTFSATATDPPPPAEPLDFAALSVGSTEHGYGVGDNGHTCALTPTGVAYCWGANDWGQIGDSTYGTTPYTPRRVAVDEPLASITAGVWSTCALTPDGRAYCWGFWGEAELEHWSITPSDIYAVNFEHDVRFQSIEAGRGTVCGLTPAGTVDCLVQYQSRGLPGSFSSPDGDRFVSMSLGRFHVCALSEAGRAYCWDGESVVLPWGAAPTAVGGDHVFDAIVAGEAHACGLTAAGAAYCWGDGEALGYGSGIDSSEPVPVSGGHAFVALSAGRHTCGVTAAGAAYCWGSNEYGQLGDGSTADRLVPVAVAGDLSWVSISAGSEHTCATTADARAYCWGRNWTGALGDGTTTNRSVPVQVTASGSSEK